MSVEGREYCTHYIFPAGYLREQKEKHEYKCTICLGEGRKETAGKEDCRLDVMLGGLKPVENEHVNGKVPLRLSENTPSS